LGDYISFYGFMVYYLAGLKSSLSSRESNVSEGGTTKLVLSGYSYGSMLASHLPALETVLKLFVPSSQGLATHEIKLATDHLSRGSGSQAAGSSAVSPSVAYLLVSPILPPASFFTAFSLLGQNRRLDTVLLGTAIQSGTPAETLTAHPSLAVYGSSDGFTSATKLRDWAAQLAEAQDSRFCSHEIDGAGHFWHEDGAELQLRRTIREWLATL
jgi:alpha/beta superfamily hydrolase